MTGHEGGQQPLAGKSRWSIRWPRFRLKTLFVFVTVVAAVCAFGPMLTARYRIDRATDRALQQGTDVFWSSNGLNEDFQRLVDDADRVVDRLFRVVESKRSDATRTSAVTLIAAVVNRAKSVPLRDRALTRLVAVVADGDPDPLVEASALQTIAYWLPSAGLSAEWHERLAATAKRRALTPGWAEVLLALGGEEETLRVLEVGDSPDAQLTTAIHYSRSSLTRFVWPPLLPYAKRWLNNPQVAPAVMRYSILQATDAGREVLLDYALDDLQPLELRKKALEALHGDLAGGRLAGAELLLAACRDPRKRALLAELMQDDPEAVLSTSIRRHQDFYGDRFRNRLVDGLDPAYWIPSAEADAKPDRRCQAAADLTKQVLEALAGRTDLKSQAEWRAWLADEKTTTVTLPRLLQVVIEQPDLLSHPEIMGRMMPHMMGRMPDDCLPLYRRMLRKGPPDLQYWAAQALLRYTDDVEAVPILMGRLAVRQPDPGPGLLTGTSGLLHERFGVNYFRDVAAWKAWWRSAEEKQRSANADQPDLW